MSIHEKVCNTPSCIKNINSKIYPCGKAIGYWWLDDPSTGLISNKNYINSSIPNRSHDMRLLYETSRGYNCMLPINTLYKDPDIPKIVDQFFLNCGNYGKEELVP